jgi:hypothetical protein
MLGSRKRCYLFTLSGSSGLNCRGPIQPYWIGKHRATNNVFWLCQSHDGTRIPLTDDELIWVEVNES